MKVGQTELSEKILRVESQEDKFLDETDTMDTNKDEKEVLTSVTAEGYPTEALLSAESTHEL